MGQGGLTVGAVVGEVAHGAGDARGVAGAGVARGIAGRNASCVVYTGDARRIAGRWSVTRPDSY